MGKDPLVSICIPAYNHARFLGAAIESALAQTVKDCEIVVSDNRSTDDTQSVVSALTARDSRIRYELAPAHIGMAENFNRCWGLARGRYVKFLCADDSLEPSCVERLLAPLRSQEVALAACARYLVSDIGLPIRVAGYAATDWSGPGEEAARRCFFLGNRIGEPTAAMFRRETGERFDPRYFQAMDIDLWLRLLERGRLAFVAEPLCRIRQHSGQATRNSAASGRISADKRLLFHDYAERPYLRGTIAERLLWDFRMAWSRQREPAALRGGNLSDALYYPGLWKGMVAGAALARLLRAGA